MAGSRNSNFNEKLTPYLQQKLVETSEKYGIQSEEYQAFEKQYLKSTKEDKKLTLVEEIEEFGFIPSIDKKNNSNAA